MPVYKGAAYCQVLTGTGNRFFAVTMNTADPTPDTRADHTSFEQTPPTNGAVTLVFSQSTSGLSPPGVANSVVLTLFHANTDTVAARATISPGGGSQVTVTLHLTSTGTSTGAPLIGDFRLHIRAVRTDLTAYDVDSDVQNFKGFIRSNPTLTTVQVWHTGPANPGSFEDSIETNIDLSHSPGLDLPHRHFDVVATNASTGVRYASGRTEGTDPQNHLMRIDNRFPAELTSVGISVDVVAVPSSIAPDSEPTAVWMLVPTTTTGVTANRRSVKKGPLPINASIWIDHHLQVNNKTYDPAKAVEARLTADLGFVTSRVLNARNEPISGITYRSVFRDAGELLPPAIDRTVTTGVNGTPPEMAVWDAALPGGPWSHTTTITEPAHAVGLDFNRTERRTLLAANPALALICGAGPSAADTDERHLEPGMEVLVGLTIANVFTGESVPADPGTAACAVARFNLSLARAEFLDADGVWKPTRGNLVYYWPLSPSPGDRNTYITIFSADKTGSWGVSDLFVVGVAEVSGVPLTNFMKEVVVQGVNNHNFYKFDGAGFLGFPTR